MITMAKKAIALLCSRRAGKTIGLVHRTAKLSHEQPGRRTLYVHHTRANGKEQFFDPLVELLEEHGVQFEKNETALTVSFANGSYVKCVGCDSKRAVGRKLGFGWYEIILDETQEYDDGLLKRLLDKSLLPTLFDHGGTIILAGTPPDVQVGVWWDTINSEAFEQVRWTLLDNPHIERKNIVDTYDVRGFKIDFEDWTNNAPIVQREVFGLPTIDPDKIVYEYKPGLNDIPADGPHFLNGDDDKWCHAMGIDLGFSDNDAIFVWKWRRNDPLHRIYQAYSWKKNHVLFDELAEKAKEVYRHFRPLCVVGDTGGHGAVKVIESLADRLGIGQIERKPANVKDSVALLNDEYRAGRAFIVSNDDLAIESRKVSWDESREKFDSSFHSDITEAARYAHHAALLAGYYRGKAVVVEKTDRERRNEGREKRLRARIDPLHKDNHQAW